MRIVSSGFAIRSTTGRRSCSAVALQWAGLQHRQLLQPAAYPEGCGEAGRMFPRIRRGHLGDRRPGRYVRRQRVRERPDGVPESRDVARSSTSHRCVERCDDRFAHGVDTAVSTREQHRRLFHRHRRSWMSKSAPTRCTPCCDSAETTRRSLASAFVATSGCAMSARLYRAMARSPSRCPPGIKPRLPPPATRRWSAMMSLISSCWLTPELLAFSNGAGIDNDLRRSHDNLLPSLNM